MKKGVVTLTRFGDLWTVSVFDQSIVQNKTFLIEEYAESWARGQAVRLGVSVELLAEQETTGH